MSVKTIHFFPSTNDSYSLCSLWHVSATLHLRRPRRKRRAGSDSCHRSALQGVELGECMLFTPESVLWSMLEMNWVGSGGLL